MTFLLVAALVTAVGLAPLYLTRKWKAAAYIAPLVTGLLSLAFYVSPPDLVNPFWGGASVVAMLLSAVIAGGAIALDRARDERDRGRRRTAPAADASQRGRHGLLALVPLLMLLCLVGRWVGSWPMFRSSEYAGMLGSVQSRVWTQDVQPKDPNHVRKVPEAYATWVANKQLGAADSALGSQFELDSAHMTIQMVRGEIWFIVPLRFKDWGTWRARPAAPGFIMVSAEDPNREPVSVLDRQYAYMPSAYFGNNLERHLWSHGYADRGLSDFTFEVDEDNHGWWVVTVIHPTIGWSASVVEGVVIVNPTDGSASYYDAANVPKWVDRVMPPSLLNDYMTWHGKFSGGWLNSWFSENNLTQPEDITFVHGSDDEPYFVADITSTNVKDEALLGLMYVSARSGRATFYKAKGVTSHAALQAVDAKVAYRKWQGQTPVLYNMYGTMADIVPLIAANSTYQGVAIVNIAKPQDVAVGADMAEALREYQKLLTSGSDPAPELAKRTHTVTGTVVRFSRENSGQGTSYFLLLKDGKTIFTTGGELSPKLPLTREGDTVTLTYVDSGEAVEPLLAFDNASIQLEGALSRKTPVDRR